MLGLKTVVIAFFLVLLGADTAWAWGPATHIGLGETTLSQLTLLPAAIAAILGRNPLSYLYGSIAADVVFAKRWSRVKQFCHHWSTGFRLLECADDEKAQAFAYGYLSHLAADTVAHGKYVPHQIATSGTSQNFGHFYWELRADSLQAERTWSRLRHVLSADHEHHHDELRGHITDTLLSYPVNRVLFDGLNAVAVQRSFRRTIDTWGRLSRWPLRVDFLRGYESESVDRVLSVLAEGPRSAVLREDPNGTAALMSVRVRRMEERRRKRRGVAMERRLRETAQGFAPRRPLLVDTIAASPVRLVAMQSHPLAQPEGMAHAAGFGTQNDQAFQE